jgi:protocatechuate 3,4-dioxygenase beta subunit
MPLESHLRIPQETAVGNVGGQAAAGEAKIAELTLPPIVLRRASMLSGTVRDETGEPVSGAIVTASWIQQENTISSLRSDTTATDAAGKFELTRVYPQVDALVTATTSDKSVMQATAVNSSRLTELELTVTSEGMLPIVGVIQGTDGAAVAKPIIKVTRAMTAPNGHNYGGAQVVEWSDSREILGGDDGRFTSPGPVARLGKYSFSISAPGYLSTETPFLDPSASGAAWQLDPITLTKARNIRGLVRDASGQPLAGATVSSWTASTDRNRNREVVQSVNTDERGRFVLTDLHPAAPLAFVKLEGYRPSGTALTDDNQDVQLTLYRDEESIATEHRVAPGLLQDDRHRAAAIRLMEAMLPEQRGSNHFHGELLNMMLRVDPNLVVAELSEVKSADARARLLVQLGEVDDALAEVETIEDGYMRTYCRLELCQHIEDADERREFLAAALVDAQTITRPDRRAVIVASIAEKFAELGDNDRVATILREELPQVQALSTQEWPGFARGYFAAQFARVEPETALEMASEAPPDEQVRHYQNVAHVLGNVNPELAEQTLGRITNNRYVNSPVVRVVYRMASVDLERAIRLAEGIQDHSWPGERSRGLGVIAWAIRQEQPEKARGLLRQAFAALPDSRASQHSHASATFGAAMDLLRWAEQIDPERLTDYFWTTVSHFGGMSGGAWSPDQAMEADAEQQSQLVLLLSLYSIAPDVPRQLIAPGFEYWESQIGQKGTRFTDGQGTFMAMALSDPERAVDFAVRFHQGLDAEHRRYIPQPWEVIGHALTRNRDELSEAITRDVFHRWVVDKFDL